MTDEKKKPEEDELSEEQLDDVAGGIVLSPVGRAQATPSITPSTGGGEQPDAMSKDQDAINRALEAAKDAME